MASSSWEERYLASLGNDAPFDALRTIGKTAGERARELGDDDLADDLNDGAKAVQLAMDDLQDLFVDLDNLEKEGEGEA